MKYYKTKDKLSNEEYIIIKNSDESVIFFTNQSPHYQAYLAWVAEGNEAEEWSAE